jgi:hypothetical protein
VLAVLIGFLEVRQRWKERLSRTTTKDEDDLVAAALRCLPSVKNLLSGGFLIASGANQG